VDRELWPILYHALRVVSRADYHKGVQYPSWVIVAVLLWAAIHDRPRSWACNPDHWDTTVLRPDKVPSASTVSRRACQAPIAELLERLGAHLRGGGPPAWALVIDGKPLPVGKCSKDPDALPNPHGKGYKLHALWGSKCMPEAWEVTAANEYEGAAAERLLGSILGTGFVLADGSYEANRVYDAAAGSCYQLLAHPGPEVTGGGHGYQSEHRMLALHWFGTGLGWDLYRYRSSIERRFGNMGVFGGGLGPLPNWVRRLGRVTCWVHCKLLINAARIIRKQQRMQPMQ
jgi:Transposase DDE domain